MAGESYQPLQSNVPLVNPDGTPTPFFIQWAQQRGIDINDAVTLATLQTIFINAGVGLSGGGSLAASRTLNLANTSVVAGAYTNANITVDPQGRLTAAANGSSGGGSNERARVIPVAANFTIQNANSATMTGKTYGLLFDSVNATGGIRFCSQNAALPATPYSIIMRGQPVYSTDGAGYHNAIVLRNSGSGKIIIFGSYNFREILVQNWSAYNTYNSNIVANFAVFRNNAEIWKKVTNDGTNLTFHISTDGDAWYQLGTVTLAAFIASVDQAGFGFYVGGSIYVDNVQSWEVV